MEVHERVYRELKKSGSQGWGGSSFTKRIRGWEEQLDKIFKLIQLSGNRVLELGSGAGDVSLRVAHRGYHVTGVEISPTAVEWAKQKAEEDNLKIKFICQSVADRTILDGEKFDLIIDGNCLHCLFDEDRVAFYDNMERLTNLDGYVFISSAISSNEDEETPKISPIKRCFVNRESIVEELRKRGFGLLEEWCNNGTHEHYYGLFRRCE